MKNTNSPRRTLGKHMLISAAYQHLKNCKHEIDFNDIKLIAKYRKIQMNNKNRTNRDTTNNNYQQTLEETPTTLTTKPHHYNLCNKDKCSSM